ncbi:TetR/AcrR family transcriptional regulator [Cryptosporangium phraense]|uniref:TetR family transcriptional regulator n=1 Tax=Cryptosporangium phraense TaxID=2593070 RepID=A0A545AT10_9ACTN|nr:TetR/AcrR family transcriptional regulator [Cryptosporangium phraense]TQS44474.1 TetR family transcriptional regulator [Cryptosporangium phraense]
MGDARSQRPDRRVARRLANRSVIEDAALRLFAEKGYEATTVDEIAAEAGVSVRSFHYHFPTKRDVLVGDLSGKADELASALAAQPDGQHPLVALRAALHTLGVAQDVEHRERTLLRARILRSEPHLVPFAHELFRGFGRVLSEDVARRAGLDADRDAYPRLVASVAVAVLGSTMMTLASEGCDQAALDEAIDSALECVLAGLPSPGCAVSAPAAGPAATEAGAASAAGKMRSPSSR